MRQKTIYAIYTRAAASSNERIETQRKEFKTYILENLPEGVILETRYDDNGYSGMNFNRPALAALITDAKDRKFTHLITSKIRLLRAKNIDGLDSLVNKFKELNIEIIFTEL